MSDEAISHEFALIILIILVYMAAAHILEAARERGKVILTHESAVVTILGMLLGAFLKYVVDKPVEFNSEVFFYLVLPPVIFAQGYTLKRKRFFRYFHYIVLFGLIGTLINFLLISYSVYLYSNQVGMTKAACVIPEGGSDDDSSSPCDKLQFTFTESMLLGSVLSASDEVAAMSLIRPKQFPKLGALIFGEGVLNDALSIVLFQALFNNYNDSSSLSPFLPLSVLVQVFGSIGIGVSVGMLASYMLKRWTDLIHDPMKQVGLVLLMGYLSYGVAEALNISGILTLFFNAIIQAHYGWHSLSKPAKISSKIAFQLLSEIAEAFSFAYVGLSLWSFSSDGWSLDMAFFTLGTMCVCRLIMILFMCFVTSKFSKTFSLPMNERIGFALGGMVRGCISWAQILQIDGNDILITSTLVCVMGTTLIFGTFFPVILPKLGLVPAGQNNNTNNNNGHGGHGNNPYQHLPGYRPRLPSEEFYADEESANHHSISTAQRGQSRFYQGMARMWVLVDEVYLKPLLGGREPTEDRRQLLEQYRLDQGVYEGRRQTWGGEEDLSRSHNTMSSLLPDMTLEESRLILAESAASLNQFFEQSDHSLSNLPKGSFSSSFGGYGHYPLGDSFNEFYNEEDGGEFSDGEVGYGNYYPQPREHNRHRHHPPRHPDQQQGEGDGSNFSQALMVPTTQEEKGQEQGQQQQGQQQPYHPPIYVPSKRRQHNNNRGGKGEELAQHIEAKEEEEEEDMESVNGGGSSQPTKDDDTRHLLD